MKNRKQIIVRLALCAVFMSVTLFTVPQAYGATHQLYTTYGFIDLLISRGIIAKQQVERARDMVELVLKTEKNIDADKVSEDITVSVSQFIEHGDLTYNAFEDVDGLLLSVKNTGSEARTLDAKRQCQVVYRIYDESGTLLYDYANENKCQTSEKVTYILEAGATRIFPITHTASRFALKSGTYRFEIEYPGYGEGKRVVTVQ